MKAPVQNQVLMELGFGACLTPADVAKTLPIDRSKARRALVRLVDRGLVDHLKDVGCYQISAEGLKFLDEGQEICNGPRGENAVELRQTSQKQASDSFRSKLWYAMRKLQIFTINDLVFAVPHYGSGDAYKSASKYCRFLERGDYLLRKPYRRESTRRTSPGYVTFELIKDTGPLSPVVQKNGQFLYDQNLKSRTDIRGKEDA